MAHLKGGSLIQFGCGLTAPADWRNFDASPTLRLQRVPIIGTVMTAGRPRFPANVEYGDVVKGLPVLAGEARAVYCSHVLEHLSFDDLPRALQDVHRILMPGGIFRGVLPDLDVYVRAYLEDGSAEAAEKFMSGTLLGTRSRGRGIVKVAEAVMGNSHHLWMWDFKAMEKALHRAGFKAIRRAEFGDCPDPAFRSVEAEDRWLDCLGFECTR